MSNSEKTVTIEAKAVTMTAPQFMNSFFLVCTFPNGNKCLTVRKNAKTDKQVIEMAEQFGVSEYVIPADSARR